VRHVNFSGSFKEVPPLTRHITAIRHALYRSHNHKRYDRLVTVASFTNRCLNCNQIINLPPLYSFITLEARPYIRQDQCSCEMPLPFVLLVSDLKQTPFTFTRHVAPSPHTHNHRFSSAWTQYYYRRYNLLETIDLAEQQIFTWRQMLRVQLLEFHSTLNEHTSIFNQSAIKQLLDRAPLSVTIPISLWDLNIYDEDLERLLNPSAATVASSNTNSPDTNKSLEVVWLATLTSHDSDEQLGMIQLKIPDTEGNLETYAGFMRYHIAGTN
jgi:hypothetical protein